MGLLKNRMEEDSIPSVEEYRKTFANDIKIEKMNSKHILDEREQEQIRRNQACNKHILDTIAKDTKSFTHAPKGQIASSIKQWLFTTENCDHSYSMDILKRKGYQVYQYIDPPTDLLVTLKKY
jgi:23S rRNA pseudoU1915 N3-methylase RlmH